ncbi:hypothetical protein MPER_01410 [Moniliophthora perniciosa FA553]|nr:hypothetical protein MPER_01410 [Moniliophthora perniciosa FA553]
MPLSLLAKLNQDRHTSRAEDEATHASERAVKSAAIFFTFVDEDQPEPREVQRVVRGGGIDMHESLLDTLGLSANKFGYYKFAIGAWLEASTTQNTPFHISLSGKVLRMGGVPVILLRKPGTKKLTGLEDIFH